jgi:hypothetical protein
MPSKYININIYVPANKRLPDMHNPSLGVKSTVRFKKLYPKIMHIGRCSAFAGLAGLAASPSQAASPGQGLGSAAIPSGSSEVDTHQTSRSIRAIEAASTFAFVISLVACISSTDMREEPAG